MQKNTENNVIIYERKIISYLLNNFSKYKSFNDELKRHFFLDSKYQIIFNALESYYSNGVYDSETFINVLVEIIVFQINLNSNEKQNNWNVDDWETNLEDLRAQSPTEKEFLLAIKKVLGFTIEKKYKSKFNNIINKEINIDKTAENLQDIIQDLQVELHSGEDIETIGEYFINNLDYFTNLEDNKDIIYLPENYRLLNNIFKGFKPGSLITIGARPSVGKTLVALDWAHKIAFNTKESVLFVSLEMPKNDLIGRIAKQREDLDITNKEYIKLNRDIFFKKLINLQQYLSEIPLIIEDNQNLGINNIIEQIKKIHRKTGLKIVFIDYLQLISSPEIMSKNMSENIVFSDYTRKFKKLAGELGIPIVLLSQLSRNNAKENREPKLFDLRGSGSIEQDSDIVILLHRKDDEAEDSGIEPGKDLRKTLSFIVEKNRNGMIAVIDMEIDYAHFDIN